MISFAELDLMARGATLALLAMVCWLLIRDHRDALAARLMIAMNLATAAHVIASIPYRAGSTTLAGALLDSASGATIPLFWLFARAWFDDARTISWRSWVIAFIPAVMVLILDLLYLTGGIRSDGYWFPVLRMIWFAFTVAGLWTAWRGRADDLIEARRRFRLILIVGVGFAALAVNAAEIATHRLGAWAQWRSIVELLILAVVATLCAIIFGFRQSDLFAKPLRSAPAEAAEPDPALQALAERLSTHINTNKSWRDETLTIAALAAQLGEPEYRLRRLINGMLGHRNFAAYINGHRLAEVKAALVDTTQRDVPILTIALDAGFGSLGPFNRAFRDAEGMTPSEFRASNS